MLASVYVATASAAWAIACEPRRDPDYPQYTQPRWETLAWRRATDQPSPELSQTPPEHHATEPLPTGKIIAKAAPPAPSASSSPASPSASSSSSGAATGVATIAPDAGLPPPGLCRVVSRAGTCTSTIALACGTYTPGAASSDPQSDPPTESLFLGPTRARAETLAKDASHAGAVSLPARACHFVAVDLCARSADVVCTDDAGQVTRRAHITM